MNKDEMRKLLLLGQGQSVEFKARCSADVIGRHVRAFLNSGGGYVVCGVGDKGSVVGVGPDEDMSSLEAKLTLGISPKALVSLDVQEIDGKRLVVVEVPAGKDMPYAFRNEVLVREGGGTVRAGIGTIRDMVLRRQAEPERWERRLSPAELEDDVDTDEVYAAVRAVNKTSHIPLGNSDDPTVVLEDMGVARYGRLTNGGDVLFGKNPALRYPQVGFGRSALQRTRPTMLTRI